MSNNKQSSGLEYLIEKLKKYDVGVLLLNLHKEEIKQAKAMCITEHENTWNNAINAVEKDKWDSFEEYYNETFGGNNDGQI